MKLFTALATTTTLLAAPAFAQEMEADVANGESEFARQCVSCHVVADESGEVLAGRAGRIGPNLYGVIGRQPGSVEDFRYSDAIVAYGELSPADDKTGAAPQGDDFETVVWGKDNTIAYLEDPTAFLRDALDDPRARSKMAYKVRDAQAAVDIQAYLATFSPDFELPGDAMEDGAMEDEAEMEDETMEDDAMGEETDNAN
ncbi:c-type cytochrome [Limimaricola sp.]|uniref:c-type cytochrome n=1 Tax=Limimaricola sp. TaxID=2211665 RepID=UPI0040595968